MCGITAYLGNNNAFEIILQSLALLQNRGYDSIGIATIHDKLVVSKYATHSDKSGFDRLSQNAHLHSSSSIGIGHTRWATHGPKTDQNSHPHTDTSNRIAVVHNGIIENYLEIRNKLMKKNIQFVSETDTEVIPKLLEYYLDIALQASPTIDFEHDVVRPTIQELQGTWAIVIVYTETPHSLYISKQGSPLVLGMNDTSCMIASEQLPLSAHFTHYMSFHDGDIVEIKKSDTTGKLSLSKNTTYITTPIENTIHDTSCEPYPHWTLKEIFEQGKSIVQTLQGGSRLQDETHVYLSELDSYATRIAHIQNIIILGCGTSLHAGQVGATIMRTFRLCKHIQTIDASEFTSDFISTGEKTLYILLSQSGETKDVHRCIELIRETDSPILSIVNVVGSLIARESDYRIYVHAGREVGVASTKSFTCQVVALALFTIWYAQNKNIAMDMRKQYIHHVKTLYECTDTTLQTLDTQMKHIAKQMLKTEHMFLLGRGPYQHIADEAALKIKEIGYIHAEGYPGGSLKHGPFALIDTDTVVILIAPRDSNFTKMIHAAEEIKSRNANIYMITTPTSDITYNTTLFQDIIYVPENTPFQHIVCMLPLQLLAYYISVGKGNNPDFPRNLAKVVTVDG